MRLFCHRWANFLAFATWDILLTGREQLIARKQTIFDDNERRMFLQRVLYARPMPIIFYERISELIKERTGIKISQAHMVEATSIYRASYDINAFFAMRTTVAYSVRPEFAVVATRRLERSTFIKGLTGILIPMEDTGEPPSPDTRRSTIVTHGKRHTMQLMGPLSRVNHDCRDYSTELVKIESILGFGQLAVRSVREILPGEEITFNYGSDYFGPGNEDCMCASCSSRWTDPSISDVGDGTRTRKGLLAVKQASLANTIYTYDEVPPQPGANNAREYLSNLPDEASERCMALHCRMRFTSLPFGALCTCCAEQISILDPAPDTLHRYYQSVLTGGHVLGLYHTKLPLHTVRDYLQTLALPDFRVFPRPLRFNSKLHKNHAQNPKNNPSFDANDSSAGSTCDAAAAAGANQKGHIWMLIGDWRSEGSTNLAKFGSGQLPLYACLVILRHNTVTQSI